MSRVLHIVVAVAAVIIVFSGCRSREPLELLTPEEHLEMGRPAEATGRSTAQARSPAPEQPVVVLETNLGAIHIVLDPERAPRTVENFLEYVRSGFYDGTIFHRVIPGFVAQAGGFNPELEPKETRDPIASEADNGLRNTRRSVAMARRDDVDSATSQFFINLDDNPFLDHDGPYQGYTVFGRVIDGMHVVNEIASRPTESRDGFEHLPENPVMIERARLSGN